MSKMSTRILFFLLVISCAFGLWIVFDGQELHKVNQGEILLSRMLIHKNEAETILASSTTKSLPTKKILDSNTEIEISNQGHITGKSGSISIHLIPKKNGQLIEWRCIGEPTQLVPKACR
jgi:hypothetical protein